MNNIGLVTGASSGIGRALAHEHARRGRDLILVARGEDELNTLAESLRQKFSVDVLVMAKDLTETASRQELFEAVEADGLTVEYLFNNAGFGGAGQFVEQEWSLLSGMMELNMRAVAELMHLFLPGMVARGKGKVLNTSSTAGFMPGPMQAVYFATKAFVNSLSKGVASELQGSGVTVTALCPGAVDTGFADTAGLSDSKLFESAATPQATAAQGYTAMEAGRLEVITEIGLAVAIKGFIPFVPERLAMAAIKKIQS
ncbi:putative oxidoreductase [Neolewinella maritima]|uniref:Oxidoreductase n=1 Tax=Neolewinella maritima TaxID=1383882 RepID=A0ABN8F631_9BACT|nr:SDR family oxidoreductase [Neolewinella maritima]CAH1000412.1 putative oxidoreductase [Neolewinella maritima]